MIELSLTIEIYIAGVKNRAGFATDLGQNSLAKPILLSYFSSYSYLSTTLRLTILLV